MTITSKYPWTIRFFFLGLLIIFIAVFAGGGGHGSIRPAIYLLPLGMIGISFQQLTLAPLFLGLIQYPIYGFILDKVVHRSIRATALVLVIAAHILLVLLTFYLRSASANSILD